MDIHENAQQGHEAMVIAIRTGQPGAVFGLLQTGVPANNLYGKNSYIAFAMFHHNAGPCEDRRTIADILLDHGARLDHFTEDEAAGSSALKNAQLWRYTPFSVTVIFTALSYALQHKQPLPRLLTGAMPYDGLMLADSTHTRLHLANSRADAYAYQEQQAQPKIQTALRAVEAVQDAVAFRLDNPETTTQIYVAQNLPAREQNFWRNPETDALGRGLRLSGLK